MKTFALPLALAGVLLASAACAQPAPPPNPTTFMAQNALADGVKTLPTGVQYKVIRSGAPDGPHPKPTDKITVNYEGSLLDGKVFDTGQRVSFQLGNLIPGWIDALQNMRPGDSWIVWVPPSQGYGAKDVGPIPGNSVLVFKLDLLSVG